MYSDRISDRLVRNKSRSRGLKEYIHSSTESGSAKEALIATLTAIRKKINNIAIILAQRKETYIMNT